MAAQFSSTNGPSARGPRRVDRARGQLLAGARLAGQEDRRAGVAEAIGAAATWRSWRRTAAIAADVPSRLSTGAAWPARWRR